MKAVLNLFSAVGFIILTGSMVVSGNSLASTLDGATPAQESICDPLKADGITKGLYGLCVAYCEAQDLDRITTSEPPSPKILANYNKKKQSYDPDMPCVHTPCPCWTESDITIIVSDQLVESCVRSPMSSTISLTDSNPDPVNDPTFFRQAAVDTDAESCFYVDTTKLPPVNSQQSIGPDAAAACAADLNTACDSVLPGTY